MLSDAQLLDFDAERFSHHEEDQALDALEDEHADTYRSRTGRHVM